MALIERGADIDARDDDQRTPLHVACDNGHTEVAMALMERGADARITAVSEYCFFGSICFVFNFPMIRFRLMSTFIRVFRRMVELPSISQERRECQWINCWPPASDMSQDLSPPGPARLKEGRSEEM